MSEIDNDNKFNHAYQKGYTKGFIDGEAKYLDFIVKQEHLKVKPIYLKCHGVENCPLKEEKQREWIPVSERLPEESKNYNVSCKNEKGDVWVTTMVFMCGMFGYSKSFHGLVTAWRELPEPYKKVKP